MFAKFKTTLSNAVSNLEGAVVGTPLSPQPPQSPTGKEQIVK